MRKQAKTFPRPSLTLFARGFRDRARFHQSAYVASPGLAASWFALTVAAGLLPAVFVWTLGALLAGDLRTGTLVAATSITFTVMNFLPSLLSSVSECLGDEMVKSYDSRLMTSLGDAPSVSVLEDAEVMGDIALARDFDLALDGPPLSVAMNLIALGNAGRITSLGMAAIASLYLWWAGPVLVTAWLATRLINHSWKGPDTATTGQAQRRANYYYEICVDAPAAKEVRVFDLASWASSKFTRHRTLLADERISQASLGGGRIALSLIVLVATHMAVFASFAQRVSAGSMSASELTVAALASLAVAGLGFGGADWVYDQCSGVTAALERVERECRADPGDAQGLGETVSGPSGAKLNDNIQGHRSPLSRGLKRNVQLPRI